MKELERTLKILAWPFFVGLAILLVLGFLSSCLPSKRKPDAGSTLPGCSPERVGETMKIQGGGELICTETDSPPSPRWEQIP